MHHTPFLLGNILQVILKKKHPQLSTPSPATATTLPLLDLLSYAPGMNTSMADMLATVEAEAFFSQPVKTGKIDPGAKKLFDQARKSGWRKLSSGDKDGKTTFEIVFKDKGRFAYQRTLPLGLNEIVVCDGLTLLHLYPQLGLGAKRQVSRFHRSQIESVLPWTIVPPEDLARDADVKLVGPGIVDVIPHYDGPKTYKDKDGKTQEFSFLRTRFVFSRIRALSRNGNWFSCRRTKFCSGKCVKPTVRYSSSVTRTRNWLPMRGN